MTFYIILAYVILPLIGVACGYFLRNKGLFLASLILIVSVVFLVLRPPYDSTLLNTFNSLHSLYDSETTYIMTFCVFGLLSGLTIGTLIYWVIEFIGAGYKPFNIFALILNVSSLVGLLAWIIKNIEHLKIFFAPNFYPIGILGLGIALMLFIDWVLMERSGSEAIAVGGIEFSNFSFEKKEVIDPTELEKYKDVDLLIEHSVLGAISPSKMKKLLVAVERSDK